MDNSEFTENTHPVLAGLRKQIVDLEKQVTQLKFDNLSYQNRINTMNNERYTENENIRDILIEAVSDGDSVSAVAKSVADVLGISLLKSITVTFPITVEASMLVPFDFDIRDLDIHDVGMDAFNSDIEDFAVESWDVGHIEEM